MTEHLKIHGIMLEIDEGKDQSGYAQWDQVYSYEQQEKTNQPKIQQTEQQEKSNQPKIQRAEPQKHDHLTLIANSVHNASKALMEMTRIIEKSKDLKGETREKLSKQLRLIDWIAMYVNLNEIFKNLNRKL